MKFCWSVFIEPRTKVHRIDEEYAWVHRKTDFTEDPKNEISGDRIFQVYEASYSCITLQEVEDSSYLDLLFIFGPGK